MTQQCGFSGSCYFDADNTALNRPELLTAAKILTEQQYLSMLHLLLTLPNTPKLFRTTALLHVFLTKLKIA